MFTLTCSDDYDFMDVLPSYQIIGETDGYVYYVSLPTDVQGYMKMMRFGQSGYSFPGIPIGW